MFIGPIGGPHPVPAQIQPNLPPEFVREIKKLMSTFEYLLEHVKEGPVQEGYVHDMAPILRQLADTKGLPTQVKQNLDALANEAQGVNSPQAAYGFLGGAISYFKSITK